MERKAPYPLAGTTRDWPGRSEAPSRALASAIQRTRSAVSTPSTGRSAAMPQRESPSETVTVVVATSARGGDGEVGEGGREHDGGHDGGAREDGEDELRRVKASRAGRGRSALAVEAALDQGEAARGARGECGGALEGVDGGAGVAAHGVPSRSVCWDGYIGRAGQ